MPDLETVLAPTTNDAAAVVEVAHRAAGPRPIEHTRRQALMVPDGAVVALLNPDADRLHPDRKTGEATLYTQADFLAFVKRHETAENLTVWVEREEPQEVIAVLNDHGPEGKRAQWGDFRARLVLRQSIEWKHWIEKDREMMPQTAFAEHVEEGLGDVAEPSGGDLLEMAQGISGTTSASFRSGQRLADGSVSYTYDEDSSVSGRGATGETLEIPKALTLNLRPFYGGPAYNVTARLRTRLADGKLRMGYLLDRPTEVIDAALAVIAEELRKEFADRVFVGYPAGSDVPVPVEIEKP